MQPVQSRYFQTVLAGFNENASISEHLKRQVSGWVKGAQDEEPATALVSQLNGVLYPTSSKRYRFTEGVNKDQLLKAIFEASFKKSSEAVISAAEAEGRKAAAYPLWKRVLWIQAPEMTAAVIGNIVVKVVISIAIIYYSSAFGYRAYEATTFVFTAKVIPFVINNTPLVAIRALNQVLAALDWTYSNPFKVVGYVWITQTAINYLPEIPYVSPMVRTMNVWNIFMAIAGTPLSVGQFISETSVSAATTVWYGIDNISLFCRDVATKSRAEQLMASKELACQLWLESAQPQPAV